MIEGVKRELSGDGWTIYQGNSQHVIAGMSPATVDALITDPPYSSGGFVRSDRIKGTGTKYSTRGDEGHAKLVLSDFEGDNRDQRSFLAWAGLWLWEARDVVKKGGLGFVFTDWRQLPITTDAFQVGGWVWRGIFSWDKLGNHRRAGYGRFSARCEFGVWGSNGPMSNPFDKETSQAAGQAVLEGSYGAAPVTTSQRTHVTEKPVSLMGYIAKAVNAGGVVLDPFMGVGSTGVGALGAGRRFVGIELDSKAFERAARRLEHAAKAVKAGKPLEEEA